MERRFKIAHVSYSAIATYGKGILEKVQDGLPDGSTVMRQEEDFKTGSQVLLIHNESFGLVGEGAECPKLSITIAEDSVIIT